ncbi:MAG: aldehyde dehydrogenase family protein [Actinomycetes bacterium]|jgi:betaine-aldehyde dehydrogenase|nr:aldehyde dehydrogenase family protein [Actinomycetes bacterium]
MGTKLNYIAGEWVPALSGATREITNPANGEVIAVVAEGDVADARAAIAAAKKSFYDTGEWRRMDVQVRADIMFKVASLMEEAADELARLDTIDNGKPLREAEGDVDDAIHCFRYYAGYITKPAGETYDVNTNFGDMHSYTVHEPTGVCAQITPWNYPLLMAAWKLAPALAAGNSVVFKPSTLTPLSTIKLFEIFEAAGIPAGAANLVMGGGPTVGAELAANPDVDMVTFTGSTEVGRSIMTAAAGNIKKIGLELGGKSPNVIFADADLTGAVEWAMIGIFFNQGEVCSAGSRIIIEESFKDEFVQALVKKAAAMTIGDPLDNPDMGPLISESHMNRVLGYIQQGIDEGATVAYGGKRLTDGDLAAGYYVQPTIFTDCTSDMTIVREEIFGPVVTIQTFTTEQEAIALANDTIYGLAGAVFTADITRALRVIKEIRAGITWVNCYNPTYNEAPWGGYKQSGIGRELGKYGLEEYQEVKQININLSPGAVGWYEN